MSATRSIRAAYDLQGGLTGRTAEERREIRLRIDRVSEVKGRLDGRLLSPFEIAVALGADARSPRKWCKRCRCWLPATDEYFYLDRNRGQFRPACKPCFNRRYRPGARMPSTEERLRKMRDYMRAYRAARRAAPEETCQ